MPNKRRFLPNRPNTLRLRFIFVTMENKYE